MTVEALSLWVGLVAPPCMSCSCAELHRHRGRSLCQERP